MWEMSKPGSETEGLFLRVDHKEYYEVEPDQDIPFEWMPSVRSPIDYPGFDLNTAWLSFSINRFKLVSLKEPLC